MPTPAKARSRKTTTSVIILMPEQTIRNVNALRAELLAGLNGAARVRLVTAELVHVDTATLQLLCAFMLEARQRGIEVEWDTPSEALSSSARLLGVNGVLALE
jgi:ABC-type transporter Mla MlaB component